MPGRSLTVEEVLTVLGQTPEKRSVLSPWIETSSITGHPSPDEWSANEVLGHLRACADVWGECMMTILAEDNPTIRAVNPRTWIESTDYLEQAFRPSLQAFASQRAQLMTVLEPLAPASWARAATVTGAGNALRRTVHVYGQRMARHERPHLKQIRRIAESLQGKR